MKAILITILFTFSLFAQQLITPLEDKNYSDITFYDELIEFCKAADEQSDLLKCEYKTASVEGRDLVFAGMSNDNFDAESGKTNVFIFAQQHGNEQSGKEGALLLLKEIASGELDYLFDKLNLILVPQVNPDGSEADKRRNANDEDLNRNHLILTEPEVRAIHECFNQYRPEVTLDVHEYGPYSTSWREKGYMKWFDEQLGCLTNINISEDIRKMQKEEVVPYIGDYLNDRGYTYREYIVGGPPGERRIRFSTVDINDGRQSFGILNTFSFILEGKNGKDSVDNLERRAKGQLAAMKGFLQYCYENAERIKEAVTEAGKGESEFTAIRMEHVNKDGSVLELRLRSVHTGNDTVITVKEFHPVVEALLTVETPEGYLVNKNNTQIVDWMKRHELEYEEFSAETGNIYKYVIDTTKVSEDEELENYFPGVQNVKAEINNPENYYYLHAKGKYRTFLPLALEPQSQIGLVQYDEFKKLLKQDEYPILRVE